MSQYILGISAFYHDSAAALIKDGKIIAAAQEERFSRKKHDPRFPHNAINYCLEEAFIEGYDIDLVCYYDHPLLTYDRIIKNAIMAGPASKEVFTNATNSIMGVKLWIDRFVQQSLGSLGKTGKVLYAGHHISHAASAFYPSEFKEAAILTLDGVGEWATTTIGKGTDNNIELIQEINYPHSLGLLYSAFTNYCGFKVNSGEYKLMGLAPYGQPLYTQQIYDNLIDVKKDGSYRLNMDYFAYLDSTRTINEKFSEVFGDPPRKAESRITKKYMDIAASIQKVTEEIVIKIARHTQKITGSNNLCLAGGVALNCVANGKLLRENIFENIWIQPAAGDAGGALGAAYVGHYLKHKAARVYPEPGQKDLQYGSYLGPEYSPQEIIAFMERHDYVYHHIPDDLERNATLAKELAEGKVVGFFADRMEYGPRSLGARSIIGDARNKDMQSRMNLKIKYRESFRPFAPVCLAEDVNVYFDLDEVSPYMLLVAPVQPSRWTMKEKVVVEDYSEDMIKIINQPRSDIPAITHVDFSARVQTVDPVNNSSFYKLLTAFKQLTGYGILVNTSFNVRGEPIVCTPKDAYTCFMRTEMDILVLNDFVLYKSEQPHFAEATNWQEQFELD